MGNPIYFIAILPSGEIRDEITAFKMYAKNHFKSKHALNAPPHITMMPPFRWKAEEIEKLESTIEEVAATHSAFYLQLLNFSSFAPRVLFIDVEKKPALLDLQKDLEKKLEATLAVKNNSPHNFSPHVTVAYKDLKRQYFLRAWAHFSQIRYERIFQVHKLTLLQHLDGLWQVQSEFSLR